MSSWNTQKRKFIKAFSLYAAAHFCLFDCLHILCCQCGSWNKKLWAPRGPGEGEHSRYSHTLQHTVQWWHTLLFYLYKKKTTSVMQLRSGQNYQTKEAFLKKESSNTEGKLLRGTYPQPQSEVPFQWRRDQHLSWNNAHDTPYELLHEQSKF